MSSNWQSVKLTEICLPKQWPTIAKKDLQNEGFPVFGANGLIGYHTEFNHSHETILVGCRGSCGTLHIAPAKSYSTNNAMALDDLDTEKVDLNFLYHLLSNRGFEDVISGSSQPQITGQALGKITLKLPPLNEQRRIAAMLNKADAIRGKWERALALADDFLISTFLKMFGDPALNPKGWEMAPIRDFGLVTTGNTPSRKISQYYGDAIEWIKSDNINTPHNNLTVAKEWLSEKGREVGRVAPTGSVLVTCIAGSFDCIGNAAISDREVAFNQQINAISPTHNLDTEYLYMHLLVGKKLIQNASTNSMKGMVSKGKFQDINLMKPPKKARIEYSRAFRSLVKCRDNMSRNHLLSDDMFASVSQRAFRGEL
ncbi:restriction endonuclease subunit S [Alphaproteobacteria bacterium]|nr:restriction endonuclease subunit S [Alphaproteobacteria bacterium]